MKVSLPKLAARAFPQSGSVRQPTDGFLACPILRARPRETALQSARTNLVAPPRGQECADHKGGLPPEGYGPQRGGSRAPLLPLLKILGESLRR